MKSSAPRFAPSFLARATEPTAPGGCGTTCWRRASVVWTASDRAIDADHRLSKRVRDGVDCRQIWVSGRSPPSLPTCSTAPSRRLLPTANGLPTSRMCWTAEGWLYVRCRHRSVLAAGGWLVDECRDDGATRDRRSGDGDLAAGQARRAAAPLRFAAANTPASSSRS